MCASRNSHECEQRRLLQGARRGRPAWRTTISATAAIVAFASLTGSATASTPPSAQIERLEYLVFRSSMASFLTAAARRSGLDASFDWSTDGCSAPLIGNTGRSFDFTSACVRHDFAYRNFKRADARNSEKGSTWSSATRHRIDLQFRSDMNNHCSRRALADRLTCRSWSEVFYRLVRIAGGP